MDEIPGNGAYETLVVSVEALRAIKAIHKSW